MDSSIAKIKKEIGFLKRNVVFILILTFLCIMAKETSKPFLIASICVIALAMTIAPFDQKFCWSLFLVPNIRLFDGLESTFIVNILFVFPLFFYLFRLRDFTKIFPIIGAGLLFIMEYIHKILYMGQTANLIGWTLAFVWCCYATLDNKFDVKKNDATNALALGVIFSGVVYLANNPDFASNLIQNVLIGYRFEAYASDPNAYSTYLCVAMASFIIKPKIKLWDYFMILILMGIGLLTTSKMCYLLLIVNLAFLLLGATNKLSKVVKNIVLFFSICAVGFIFKDTILQFLDKILERAGGNNLTMDSLTSHRFTIVTDYLKLLENDMNTLLLGKGFSYYLVLITSRMQQAHNTYLDVILSWGIVGGFVFLFIMFFWFKQYSKKANITKVTVSNLLPSFVLLLSFFSLSLLSAGMFFFIVSFCMLQLKTEEAELIE